MNKYYYFVAPVDTGTGICLYCGTCKTSDDDFSVDVYTKTYSQAVKRTNGKNRNHFLQ
nr:MAG TPA: hypothetical protein [Caudoviricetes sp.]